MKNILKIQDFALFATIWIKLFLQYSQDVQDLNLNKYHSMILNKECKKFVN